ncbi:MAG: protein kinase [Catenulispora sp.]|nr:protein kinase [Catenulispora sp.]
MPFFKRTRVAVPTATEQVPGYRDLHRVGQGGFSVVYRAHQEEIGRDVALKILAVEFVDGRVLRQFLREVQLTAKLTGHPNVVTVLDSGLTASGRPYIAMDFHDRGSLRDRLRAEGPLPVREVLRVGVKIAAVLEAVHREGLLHRDVKPQNILVSRFGEPALSDFGTARLTAALDATSNTEALTPVHAAPEILQGQVPDAAADVYSLGSTLYQLLEGRPAFERPAEPGVAPLLLRVLTEPVPRMTRADVPDVVQDAITRAMARDPRERYGSAGAFAEALQGVQAALGMTVTETPEDEARVGAASATATTAMPPADIGDLAVPGTVDPVAAPGPGTPPLPAIAATPPTVTAAFAPPAAANTSPANAAPATPTVIAVPPPPQPASVAADPFDPPLAVTPWSSSETISDWKSALPPEPAAGARPSPATALAVTPTAAHPLPPTLRLPWYASRPRMLRAVVVSTGAVVAAGGVATAVALSGASTSASADSHTPSPNNSTTQPASATHQSSRTPAAPPTSIPPPSAVSAKTSTTTVALHWTLPPDGAQNPVMIVPSPNPGGVPMVSAGTGVSSYHFDGLDPKVHYCFKVGIYVGHSPDGAAVFSWADPVCADG